MRSDAVPNEDDALVALCFSADEGILRRRGRARVLYACAFSLSVGPLRASCPRTRWSICSSRLCHLCQGKSGATECAMYPRPTNMQQGATRWRQQSPIQPPAGGAPQAAVTSGRAHS